MVRSVAIIAVLGALVASTDARPHRRQCKGKVSASSTATLASVSSTPRGWIHVPTTTSSSPESSSSGPTASSGSAEGTPEASATDTESTSTTPWPTPSGETPTDWQPPATPTHTLGAQATGEPAALVAGDAVAKGILEAMNAWRSDYGVPALSWDDSIASQAFDENKACSWDYSFGNSQSKYPDVHSELFDTDNFVRAVDTLMTMYYDYDAPGLDGVNTNARGYSLILWKKATSVGCGWTNCPGKMITCMFDTQGSFQLDDKQAFIDNVPTK